MSLITPRDDFYDGQLEDPRKRKSYWVLWIIKWIIRPLAKLIFRYKIIGKDNIPKRGDKPVIIACNHVSFFDPFMMLISAFPRIVRILARDTLFKSFFGGVLARAGAIPITPESADRKALKRAVSVLRKGECLGIFPEGTRMNRPEKKYNPHAGLVLIAQMAKVDIVPAGIAGTNKIKPYNKKMFRLPKLYVNIGEPISLSDFSNLPKKERTQVVLNETMKRIYELRDEASDK